MYRLWETVVEPTLRALAPRVIVEVGVAAGAQSKKLLDFSRDSGAIVHLIDPSPDIDPAAWEAHYGSRLVFHQEKSLNALPRIDSIDAVLIDGDHNWYTVIHELKLLESGAAGEGRPGPVVLLHDVGWPYGRRDLYYDPSAIPVGYRQPHRKLGMTPDSGELADVGGLNPHLENAIYEHDLRNGVLTAIEDFRKESDADYKLVLIPGLHGIAVLAPRELLKQNEALAKQLDRFGRVAFLREQCDLIERDRLDLTIRLSERAARFSQATKREAELAEERDELQRQLRAREGDLTRLREELGAGGRDLELATTERRRLEAELTSLAGDLEARSAELKAAKAAGAGLERERARLEEQVVALNERLGEMSEELEAARADRSRLAAQAEERDGEVAELRSQVEALRGELGTGPAERPGTQPAPAREGEVELGAEGVNGDGGAEDPEAGLRAAFRERYAPVLRHESEIGVSEDVGYSLAVDGTGVLAESGVRGPTGLSVDVVVCVHNALADVRRCLWSLLMAGGHPLHLIVVDDGSDEETARFLSWFDTKHPNVELIENRDPPHGYTIAANLGTRASTADYVVLLNSDTIVNPGWVEGLIDAGESDEKIGILGPLSNAATHQSVPRVKEEGGWATNPLPPWLNSTGMAYAVSRASERLTPRVTFVNGFCYVIKRPVIDAIGYFDEETFAEGFCEENDYSVRAQDAGFSLAVADRSYVFHAKSRSYGTGRRNEIARQHYRLFLEKHGEERINSMLEALDLEEALGGLRAQLEEMLEGPDSFGRGFQSLTPNPLEVTFVLPGMSKGGGGGVHSIYQETRGMREFGVPARVALSAQNFDRAEAIYDDAAEVFLPYANEDELAELTAESDVVVATHFKSASTVARIHDRRHQDFLPAYYVQDYEPFFSEEASDSADEAVLSYGAIRGQLVFAKTHWLCSVIASMHGLQVAKVKPSIDHDVYHDEGRIPAGEGRPLRFVAMVRPRTPRRQPLATHRLLGRLQREFGDEVETITFGCPQEDLDALCDGSPDPGVEHRGLLTRQEVAEVLRESDVFLDASVYQAFGRTGLEAMACGCTSVLPRVGGIAEYAINDENALLVDTSDPEATYDELAGLVRDPERLARLQANAVVAAGRFSVPGAALSEYTLFEAAHRQRLGAGELRASQVGR